MTGQDLITGALRLIGVVASGESLDASQATDGLSALNDMLDSWSNDSLLIYDKVRETFNLLNAQKTYAWGTGAADFNSSRPLKVEEFLIQVPGVSPVNEIPCDILTKEQYTDILIKDLASTFPQKCYPDYGYPNVNINVWPVPNQTVVGVFYSWKALSQIAALTTTVSLPPGYARALRFNLAIELAPEYGKAITPEIAAIAVEAKEMLERTNTNPVFLGMDRELVAKPAHWNWRTGEPQ